MRNVFRHLVTNTDGGGLEHELGRLVVYYRIVGTTGRQWRGFQLS